MSNDEHDKIQLFADRTLTADALRGLFAQTDWARGRDEADIQAMLDATALQISAWHGDSLIGFLRVLTDFRYRAFIEDVIVDAQHRNAGIGTRLVDFALRKLAHVDEIALGCTEDNVGYYERFGFRRVGHATMHRKAEHQIASRST